MFRLIDITIDIIFFSINWKNYFDRSILVISMTVLGISANSSTSSIVQPGQVTSIMIISRAGHWYQY